MTSLILNVSGKQMRVLYRLARQQHRTPLGQAQFLFEKALGQSDGNYDANELPGDLRDRIEAAMRNEPESLEAWALANGIRVAPRT